MRQMSVISGHPIFTGFRKLTGYQQDPQDKGVTYLAFSIQKKSFSTKTKKNFIVAQQGEGLAIHTTRNYNRRVWDEAAPSRLGSFIFFNSQTCLI